MDVTNKWTENGRGREVDREWSWQRSGQRMVEVERWTENGYDKQVYLETETCQHRQVNFMTESHCDIQHGDRQNGDDTEDDEETV